MSGTARHTKEMIEQAKKKLAASTDPVDKVLNFCRLFVFYMIEFDVYNFPRHLSSFFS